MNWEIFWNFFNEALWDKNIFEVKIGQIESRNLKKKTKNFLLTKSERKERFPFNENILIGGGDRIRTYETHRLPHFKCGAINLSATPPLFIPLLFYQFLHIFAILQESLHCHLHSGNIQV